MFYVQDVICIRNMPKLFKYVSLTGIFFESGLNKNTYVPNFTANSGTAFSNSLKSFPN